MAPRMPTEYEKHVAKYGHPSWTDPSTAWIKAMNIMAGQRTLGGEFGQGMAELARNDIRAAMGSAGYGYGGGGSGGGAGGGGLGGTYQSAEDSARKANEDRYQQGLKGYRDRYERNVAAVKGMGSTVEGDIHRQFDERASRLRSSFAGNLSGNQSTVLAKMIAANDRERMDAVARAKDVNTSRLVDVDSRLSADELGFLERRTDSYPDVNQMIGLEQAAGAGSGGGPAMMGNPYGMGGGVPSYDAAQPAASRRSRTPAEADANRLASYAATKRQKMDRQAATATATMVRDMDRNQYRQAVAEMRATKVPGAVDGGPSFTYSPAEGFVAQRPFVPPLAIGPRPLASDDPIVATYRRRYSQRGAPQLAYGG
jgi:hypothetical protein